MTRRAKGNPNSPGPRPVKARVVYVDRKWPTPKSLAALRRLLDIDTKGHADGTEGRRPDDRGDLQPGERPERPS